MLPFILISLMTQLLLQEQILTRRQKQLQDEKTKETLALQSELLKKEIEFNDLKNECKSIYWNQIDTANQVLEAFESNLSVLLVMIIALTQSGKTGIMLAIIRLMSTQIDLENVYIITGHSSKNGKSKQKIECPTE